MTNEHPCAAEWLALNDYGFSIFPLKAEQKTPAQSWTAYQTRRATNDELARWLTCGTPHNVAVATGAVSGVVVLDLDSPEAEAFAAAQGLPVTPEVKTPRGRHLYFRHPGHDLPNTAGKLADKIDFRGDGGYVVGPGSYFIPTPEQAADGKIEGAYEWVEGRTPADLPFADLPAWCVPVAPQPEAPVKQTLPINHHPAPTSRTEAYAAAALAGECEAIRNAPKGQRNHQLNASAFAVAQLVAGGVLDAITVRHELESAAALAGLSKSEASATINSAWKAGAKSARTIPDDDATTTAAASVQQHPITPRALNWFTGTQAANAPPVEREWLIADLIPAGVASLLTGDGGVGKSLVAQQMAHAIATGSPLWGHDTTRAPVLAVYCEDDQAELNRRQRAIGGNADTCHMVSLFGDPSRLGAFDKAGNFHANDLFELIRDKARATGARLIILDNIVMMYSGDLNDNAQAAAFMAAMNGLARAINGAVLVLGHVAKAEGSRSQGAGAWVNQSRNHLFLTRDDKNRDMRVLSKSKANYGATGDRIELMWSHGAFIAATDMGGRTLEQVADDKRFLTSLDRFTSDEVALSINPRASNYAPKLMAETRPGVFDGNRKRAMVAAMGRLLSDGVILSDKPLGWQKANRTLATGIKRADTNPATMAKSSRMDLLDDLTAKSSPAMEADAIMVPVNQTPEPSPIVRATPPAFDAPRSDKVAQMVAMMAAKRHAA